MMGYDGMTLLSFGFVEFLLLMVDWSALVLFCLLHFLMTSL